LDGNRNLRELVQPMLACSAVHHMQGDTLSIGFWQQAISPGRE
jgi:hypothetical protein